MKIFSRVFPLLIAVSLAVCWHPARAQQEADGFASVEDLPPRVVAAAQSAKEGVILQKAKLTWRTDEGVYIVIGRRYGSQWRMNITSSGKVLSVVELDRK